MVGTGNITLLKQLSNGQKFQFTGSLEEFLLNCPDDLKTIEVEDICVIKISEEITPDQVASNLNFLGTESSDFNDDALDEYDDFDWGEYQILPGVIQRQAIITSAETESVFQVVGIEFGNKVEVFARTPPYLSTFLSDSYGEKNLLLYNQWYSEGPGPVSWEGEFAIFSIRNFLLFATQGDGVNDESLIEAGSVEDLAELIYDWLLDQGELVCFILNNITPNWSDDDLISTFQESIKKLNDYNLLDLFISDDQRQALLEVIRTSGASDARVLDILETKDHPSAISLTQYLVGLSNQGAEGSLISRGDFMQCLIEN